MAKQKFSEKTLRRLEVLQRKVPFEQDGRDFLEIALRDAYAAGCHSAQERSLFTAMDYAKREAKRLHTMLDETIGLNK